MTFTTRFAGLRATPTSLLAVAMVLAGPAYAQEQTTPQAAEEGGHRRGDRGHGPLPVGEIFSAHRLPLPP